MKARGVLTCPDSWHGAPSNTDAIQEGEQHSHREYVEGCFRCDLSREDAIQEGERDDLWPHGPGDTADHDYDPDGRGGCLVCADQFIEQLERTIEQQQARIEELEGSLEEWRADFAAQQARIEELQTEAAARYAEGVRVGIAERDAMRARIEELEAAIEAAEDFRAEIVVDAFTAPDADWNTILDSLRARIRDLQALNPSTKGEGERCQTCGRSYEVVWAAPNPLWNDLMGGSEGMLCPDCFSMKASAAGYAPFWVCHPEHVVIAEPSTKGAP